MGSERTKYTPINSYEDDRVTHEFAMLNGRRYHYVQGLPKNCAPRATVLCIHGFPDLWYSWRYQIPALLDMGLRVIAPDLIGFGQTDAPRAATPDLELPQYTWKKTAADMKELLNQLKIPKVVLFGHDWGGIIVQRIYLWHPEVVTHIICVCTAFMPPITEDLTLEQIVARTPNFKYQLRLVEPQMEKDFSTPEALGRFFRAVYRGMGDPGTGSLQVDSDIAKNIGDQALPKIWTEADHAYYVEEYTRNGIHSPLNWYKLGKLNYQDEKNYKFTKVKAPYLYLGADRDIYTPPTMAADQGKLMEKLTSHNIVATHWVLIEKPEVVMQHVRDFMQKELVFGTKEKL